MGKLNLNVICIYMTIGSKFMTAKSKQNLNTRVIKNEHASAMIDTYENRCKQG